MGWNYSSIPKLQQLHRIPTLHKGCNNSSMLGKGAPESYTPSGKFLMNRSRKIGCWNLNIALTVDRWLRSYTPMPIKFRNDWKISIRGLETLRHQKRTRSSVWVKAMTHLLSLSLHFKPQHCHIILNMGSYQCTRINLILRLKITVFRRKCFYDDFMI